MNGSSRLTTRFVLQTPADIRTQAALSDRETMETEVISTSIFLCDLVCFMPIFVAELLIHSYFNIVKREKDD